MINNPDPADENAIVSAVEGTERSAELFRLVLPAITKHGRGFSPVSYSVWYEYLRGENSELKEKIDSVIARSGRMSVDETLGLYQEHVVGEIERSIKDAESGLLDVMTQVNSSVRETSLSAEYIDSRLESFVDSLLTAQGASDSRQGVSDLKHDILSVNEKMRTLQGDLRAARESVKRMAKELIETRSRARRDPLTGLLNRRGFDLTLDEEMERALNAREIQDKALTLILIDIDHFKFVNDEYGHLTGDNVIRGVARLLDDSVMRSDYVSRFGGEEFALIMPTTDKEAGETVADRIREAIAGQKFHRATGSGKPINVTVSAGVTQYRMWEASTSFIHRADQALYEAKQSGRDQVCVSE